MSAPDFAILVYGTDEDTKSVCAALSPGQGSEGSVVHHMPANEYGWTSQGEPLILLGIGAEGCAALAKRVEQEGLEGVVVVALISPATEWSIVDPLRLTYTSLGPLEPLRAVAERARIGEMLDGPSPGGEGRAIARRYPLRMVVAVHPEPEVCGVCLGERRVLGARSNVGPSSDSLPRACPGCSGTGKVLGSEEIAHELSGATKPTREGSVRKAEGPRLYFWEFGGLHALMYPTRASLAERAITEALRMAIQDL